MTIGDVNIQGVLNPGGGKAYDLVFDMEYQVYGASVPGEALTITAKNANGNLELWVDDPATPAGANGPLEGRYYSAPANNIKSLTIRGSDDDNETIVIDGRLDLAGDGGIDLDGRRGDDTFVIRDVRDISPGVSKGTVTVNGGGGTNAIVIDDSMVATVGEKYTVGPSPTAPWTTRLTRLNGGGTALREVDSLFVHKYTLRTGPVTDIIRVEKADAGITKGVFVVSGAGDDDLYVGSEVGGMDAIAAPVHVQAAGGKSALTYIDYNRPGGKNYVLDKSTLAAAGWVVQLTADGVAPVHSKGVSRYALLATAGDDTVRINSTPAEATLGTAVLGHYGNDTVTVGSVADGLAKVMTEVRVTGGDGADDKLVVDDKANATADGTYKVYSDRVAAGGRPAIYNTDRMNRTLLGGSFGNTIAVLGNVVGVAAGTESKLAVEAGPGTDAVTVSDAADATGELGDILGDLVLGGMTAAAGGKDKVVFGDQGYAFGDTYTVRADKLEVARLPTLTVTYTGFEEFELTTGAGDDEVHFNGVTAAVKYTVAAGGAGAAGDKVFVEAGTVDDPLLTGFEHLTLSGGTLKLDTHPMTVETFTQTGGTLDGKANLTVNQKMAWTGGTMQGAGVTLAAAGSTLTINGGAVALIGRTLENAGTGTWAGPTISGPTGRLVNAGSLSPGGATAVQVGLDGSFTQTAAGTLRIDLGSAAGSDRVSASAVTLAGALSLTPITGFAADEYTVVDNTGSAPVAGAFDVLPEGAVITVGAERYKITYAGGTGNDVVLRRVGMIGDYVWYDADQDGVQDTGEYGQSGVTVNLRNTSGTLLASTTSDAYGYYSFAGLGAGSYQVEFVAPSGYSLTTPATVSVALAVGQAYGDADAGVYGSGGSGGSGGFIGDYVWSDADQDGVQDPGESGFGGATVNLRDGSGGLVASTTSDAYGYYSFGGLGAGSYQVEFVAPSGYSLTTPATRTLTLAANETRSDIDAGVYGSGGSGGSGGWIGVAMWQDPEASPTPGTAAAGAEPTGPARRAAAPTTASPEDAQVAGGAAAEDAEEPAELSWPEVYTGDYVWVGLEEDPLLAWR